MDDNRSRSLDIEEFTKAMHDYGTGLAERDVQTLFHGFDRNRDGTVDYDEFLRFIRGPLNAKRQHLVDQAWNIIDRDGSGQLDINDLKGRYDGSRHPDVLEGKKTEAEVLGEFLETFEDHHVTMTGGVHDQVVTKDEWNEYYTNVSSSIDRDDYFELMMNNAWKLNGVPKTYGTGWASQNAGVPAQPSGGYHYGGARPYSAQSTSLRGGVTQETHNWHPTSDAPYARASQTIGAPTTYAQTNPINYSHVAGVAVPTDKPITDTKREAVLDAFRQTIAKRGARGIFGIARNFRIIDDDNSKTLSRTEFDKALNDFRVPLGAEDRAILFDSFDFNKNGDIDYDEFLRGIAGPLNSFRQSFVDKAFAILDKDGSGVVDIDDIRGVYNAKKHPDVISGKITEDDALMTFLDTFESHYLMRHGGSHDHRITKDEWNEYYTWISSSCPNDQYFELMMTNAWNLNKHMQKPRGWGAQF